MSNYPMIGIEGKAHKIKEIYVGIEGKAHKIIGGFVGVNGKAKNILPPAVPIYYWDQYTVDAEWVPVCGLTNLRILYEDANERETSGYAYWAWTGEKDYVNLIRGIDIGGMTYGDILDSRYRNIPGIARGGSASAHVYPGEDVFILSSREGNKIEVKCYEVYETTEKEEKRGERTGVTVSSENPNAYPDNGKYYKDGYWYVKRS